MLIPQVREGSHGASSFLLFFGAALRLPQRLPRAHPRVRGPSEREESRLGGSAGNDKPHSRRITTLIIPITFLFKAVNVAFCF